MPKLYNFYKFSTANNIFKILCIKNFSNNIQCTPHRIWKLYGIQTYATKTVQVPQMAESITEGTLKQWNKKIGDFVKQDEEIATIETDKIDVSINAPVSGILKETLKHEEDIVQTGQDICIIELSNEPPKNTVDSKLFENTKSKEIIEESKSSQSNKSNISSEIDSKRNITNKRKNETENLSQTIPISENSKIDLSNVSKVFSNRQEYSVKMNRMRLRIASRLKESQNATAFLTTFNEVDMSSVIEMRSLYKEEILKKTGIKLGFMSAFVKASVAALKEIPVINSSITGPNGGDTIIYRNYVDISVAVATPKGLVTPVIRNAETLNFLEIEKTISELSSKARNNKLALEDMTGGTFTISNGGVFGSMLSTPIINLPQTAILGLHAIKDRPVVVNGQIVIRPIMYLALTYDHRIVDGRESVTFLHLIKEFIEDPRRLLL
ncbi:hypothetical protein T552_02098 [Pneumocystis carinii B80]|uniref:dihydrolipoyllysine-residue succinyltransferase n=1 Tax=Pneumocystis carinii (strain B80) TaxID=1408658 RepID=A0A0W4ZH02_PNEC8|nr:hypothetical protein T552_02098 [Pneumocystis carinii B80]KTW27657.1 hypothetical protein T552_02098 [Pneumocystis carinii B80]